jgi:hypothetical protein
MSTLAEIPAGIYNITEVTLIGQILPTLLFCVPVTSFTFIPLNFPVLIAVRSSRRTQRAATVGSSATPEPRECP